MPPPLDTALRVWLFALGLAIGSFLNVVIARVPEDQSIVHPRSRCPKCGRTLRWYENIPLFSWIALRARCSGCRAPISVRYPLVELLTALLFLAALARFGWGWELVSALVLLCLLVPLTFIDAEHWILPFSITLPGIAAGLVLAFPMGLGRARDALLGAVVAFVVFRAMEWIGWKIFQKEALGGGDKFLLALVGAFLTWRALLGVVFLASLQGAVFGILKLALSGRAGPAPPPAPAPPEEGSAPAAPEAAAPAPSGPLAWLSAVFLDDIPPSPQGDDGADVEEDWVPGPTNLPFGPWIALAAVELLLLGPFLAARLPIAGMRWLLP